MRPAVAHRQPPRAVPRQAALPVFEHPLEIAAVGFLARRAQVRLSVDGSAHLIAEVQQPDAGMPLVAVEHATAADAQALRDRAADMRAGAAVLVLGSALSVASHEGNAVLKMHRVRAIRVVDAGDFLFPAHSEAP